MIFDGSHDVIRAIQEKKRLQDTHQSHDHIRILCIQGGGLMRGTYGVGAAIALEELGYTEAFSFLVGISSGAPTISYFASGLAHEGIDVLLEDCCDPTFINPCRFWNQVNTSHFIDIVKSHPRKRIPVDKVFANPADIYFGVADYATAKPKILQPRDEEHFFKCMHASINMQNVSSYKVVIDGTQYADGGFTKPHVIGKAIEQLNPTHVLIITNNDRDFGPIPKFERLLNRTVYRLRLNGIMAQAINTRREARDKAVNEALNSDIPVAVVWGDGSIGATDRNPDKIKAVVEASRTWWHGLFSIDK